MPAHRKYAWDEWFGRGHTVLVQGTDYHCPQSSMSQMLRNAAYKRRLRIRLTDLGNSIIVEVTGEINPARRKLSVSSN